jgi:hypothetical protein
MILKNKILFFGGMCMLMINKNTNMEEVITMEEAYDILNMAKRLYPGFLDGVFIDYGESFAYYHDKDENIQCIELVDVNDYDFSETELRTSSEKILTYINSEFDTNFAMNLKTMTIHAICHEIGHAIDFAKNDFLQNYNYEKGIRHEYDFFYSQANAFRKEILELDKYMREHDIEENKDFIDNWKKNIDKMENELDYDYRQITSEYEADKFAAYFMKTHLRYIPQLFAEGDR